MAELRLRHGALEWREVEGEIVALDVRTSTYLAVNRTGAALWPALIAGSTHEELSRQLVEKFGISEALASEHVEAFVETLADHDLLSK